MSKGDLTKDVPTIITTKKGIAWHSNAGHSFRPALVGMKK
tara:strand:- start:9 stop:128 length:120 start_codon:yes stop_codon:yes gene_type:complete